MFDPLPPVLVRPDATNPTCWAGGRPWYMDPEAWYILRVSNFTSLYVWVNSQAVSPDELTSWHDQLKPQYRGKLSVWEPTVPGTGWLTATYLLRVLGEDYRRGL